MCYYKYTARVAEQHVNLSLDLHVTHKISDYLNWLVIIMREHHG